MLYGKMSQWQGLQKAIAEERAAYREQLKKRAELRDMIIQIIGIFFLTIFLIAGAFGIFFFAKFLKEQEV